jgi:hypothetical protein
VWSSTADPFLVCCDGGSRIEIHGPAWGTLLRRPLSEATPADLAWATREADRPRSDGTHTELLRLYRAFLELRFASAVSIVPAATGTSGRRDDYDDYDVAL